MEKKSIVEEALLSMKNLEEAVNENAKGILASTMKEEIKDLVKESLHEDDEEETETMGSEEDEMDVEDEEMMSMDSDEDESEEDSEEDEMDVEDEEMMSMDSDEEEYEDESEPIDLTGASDEEILKVFKAMGDDDGIIVKKDNGQLHLADDNADVEYLINLGESMEEGDSLEEMEFDEKDAEDAMAAIFGEDEMPESDVPPLDEMDEEMGEEDEVVYEIALDETPGADYMGEMDTEFAVEGMYETDEETEGMNYEGMYETDEETEGMNYEGMYETDEETEGMNYEMDYNEDTDLEEYNHMNEGKMTTKPKGKVGKGPKFKFKGSLPKMSKPSTSKTGTNKPKGVGIGKPRFEYKEAARTYGMGSKKGRGLRKGITPNRNLVFKEEAIHQYEEQLRILREKNEEYRKALNIFREKLNEVAVFNSNLAYATRLFTEHSTTKQEKINILRRFDGVETIKESKNLYRAIKDELGQGTKSPVVESISEKINREPSSGSAQNLIESKTYENPQFMRMKDLMSKIIK